MSGTGFGPKSTLTRRRHSSVIGMERSVGLSSGVLLNKSVRRRGIGLARPNDHLS